MAGLQGAGGGSWQGGGDRNFCCHTREGNGAAGAATAASAGREECVCDGGRELQLPSSPQV